MNAATHTELAEVANTQSAVDAMAVVTLSPEKYAAEVYQPFNERLSAAIDSVRAIDYDIKTTAGMAVAVKARATFRDLRTEADNERKDRKAPITKIGKLLESHFDMVEERIRPLEVLFDADIQAEVERKEAEKAAKIAAERARTDAIQAKIQAIRDLVLIAAGMPSAGISDTFANLSDLEIDDSFDTFRDAAETAKAETLTKLDQMFNKAKEAEAAALAAEEASKAEAARIESERKELAELRAAAERTANEQAKERQRLADLAATQEAEARRVSEKAAANLRAEQEALAEQVRLQREAAAEKQRQLDAQQSEIDAKRAAFAREQEEAAARVEAAAKMEADHADALIENAQFDIDREVDREVERARLQALAEQHLDDKRNLPPPESCCARDARIDAEVVEVSDNDIISAVMREFDWSYDEAEKNMKAIDYAAAWQERLAEMED